MLAVTAGDGVCGENSTQPTARVSTLTANGMVQPCAGSASKRSLQGASTTRSTRMSRKFSEGPWPKTGTESAKLTRIYKTALGDVCLQAMASYF
jgi:hypothetical protein